MVQLMPTAYVSSLTYKRPEGVVELLDGLLQLELPDDWDVRFLIVDNDPEESARIVVENANASFDGKLFYVGEKTPGIPAARNCALKVAMDDGATLLLFLDDDEVPQPDWLKKLLWHWQRTGAVLIGGPIRRTLPSERISLGQWVLGRSLIARRRLGEWRAQRASPDSQIIYTGNWLCQLSIVEDHGLWFDTSLQFTGGSDAAFYFETLRKGLPVGWCADAVASEPIPSERLSVGYIYGRGKAQGMVMAGLKPKSRLATFATQMPRGALGVGLMIVPVLGIASFATGLYLLGSAAGHFAHRRGQSSALYERPEAAL
jgi:glycosyltransferase involved in cell wall biosynthesis